MVSWAECLWQMVTHYRDTAADWLGGTGGKHTWCWQVCQILPVRGAAPDAHDFSRADLGISRIYFEVRRDRQSKFPCYGMVGGKRSKINTRHAPNASKIWVCNHLSGNFLNNCDQIKSDVKDMRDLNKWQPSTKEAICHDLCLLNFFTKLEVLLNICGIFFTKKLKNKTKIRRTKLL